MSPSLPRSTLRALAATARAAVSEAGDVARRGRLRLKAADVVRKGPGDFVTAVDLRVETRLRRRLLAAHPDHGFLGEEHGGHRLDADFVWVVDPIDGTSNYARGIAHHAVSAACVHRGWPVVAAMWCQPEDRLYSAVLGHGALAGRRRLRLGGGRLDDRSIVGCQWLRSSRSVGAYLPRLVAAGVRIRNLGCTVVQLCELAAGRLDGNLQEQGRLWDIAAAGLLVLEAGGRFTHWDGSPVFPLEGLGDRRHHPTLAGPPAVHRRLRALLPRTVSRA